MYRTPSAFLKYETLPLALQHEFNFKDLLLVVQHELYNELDTTNLITRTSPLSVFAQLSMTVWFNSVFALTDLTFVQISF